MQLMADALQFDIHYEEAEEMDLQLRKRSKVAKEQYAATYPLLLQTAAVKELRLPLKNMTEAFKGKFSEIDWNIVFREEHTWIHVTVHKLDLRCSEVTHKKGLSRQGG